MHNHLRVVLDTNILIRAVSSRSHTSVILDALYNQEFTLCISTDILLEYEEKISEIYDRDTAELTISSILMLPNIQQTSIYFDLRLIIPDADDDKFVNCAFSANADYLVSDDRHFRILADIDFPKIVCLTFEQFKALLKRNS